jgi:pentatricopeptide repeat protein
VSGRGRASYASVVEACGKGGQGADARSMLDTMLGGALGPDNVNYGAGMVALTRTK